MRTRHLTGYPNARPARRFASLAAGLTLLTGLALAAPAGTATPAQAGEEIIVNQTGHVDSPKIFWDGQNFTLKAKGDVIAPLEKTMNYLAKVVSGRTQEYYYTVPADPRQRFLGNPGDDLFWAPNNVVPRSDQLWIGFGADVAIPIENFRDESFTLDLVGFAGPGEMNLFVSTLDPDFMLENPVDRMLSSHEPGLRSTWIKPGLHTHNHTTFSQPGRYQLTYRASARTKDGQLIASAPQTVYWQVGGSSPAAGIPEAIPSRYNAAPATVGRAIEADAATGGTPTAGAIFRPVFSVAPAEQTQPKLTELTFTTGNPADSGTAVFYVNGYFLTEAPVSAGTAKWVELIGPKDADLQVVYIPSQTSPSPRWVSEPISYAQGDLADSTSRTGTFPTPVADETLPPFSFADRVISNPQVTLTVDAAESNYRVTATPAQADLPVRVVGGFYRNLEDSYPSCEVSFISHPQQRSFDFSTDDCYDVQNFKLSIVPDSLSPLGAVTHTGVVTQGSGMQTHNLQLATVPYVPQGSAPGNSAGSPGSAGSAGSAGGDGTGAGAGGANEDSEGAVPGDPATPTDPTNPAAPTNPAEPANPAEPTNPSVTPGTGENPAPAANPLATQPVQISAGHLDIGPRLVGDLVEIVLKDDSRQHAQQTVIRDPQSVTIFVPEAAHAHRSKRIFGDSSFDFLGEHDTHLYVLGATQQEGRPWPGFSTEDFDYQRFPQGVNLEFTPVEAPQGAKWWGFTSAPLGGLGQIIFDSSKPTVLENPQRTHLHLHWAFTQAGTYKMKVRAYVPAAPGDGFRTAEAGEQLASKETTLTFVVASATGAEPGAKPGRGAGVPVAPGAEPGADLGAPGTDSASPNPADPGQSSNNGPSAGNGGTADNGPAAVNTSSGAQTSAPGGLRLPNTGANTLWLFAVGIFTLGAGTFALALRRR